MEIEIVESVTFTMTKEEKESLIDIVKIAKRIQNINLDSNSALEDLDDIKKSDGLNSFLKHFSMLLRSTRAE